MGCGINRAKSEVVIAGKWDIEGSKTEFVWLGYSLEITDDNRLRFTESRMVARFRRALIMAKSIFQYLHSSYVKWRVFRVYIAPIIEWFLPTVVNRPIHEHARKSKIESFQFQVLCLVTGASQRCSAKGLEHVCAERPVSLKLRKFAAGFAKHVDRDIIKLMVGDGSRKSTRKLRSGAAPSAQAWPGADSKDFGDRLAILAHDYRKQPRNLIASYDPKSSKRLTFEPKIVSEWVKVANSEIKRIAHLRTIGEIF